jgi:hypothetical protein
MQASFKLTYFHFMAVTLQKKCFFIGETSEFVAVYFKTGRDLQPLPLNHPPLFACSYQG